MVVAAPAIAQTVWQPVGRSSLSLPETLPPERLQLWNQRFREIAGRLAPTEPWPVDVVFPPAPKPANPKTPPPPPQRATLRLAGRPLWELEAGGAPVNDLAETWRRSLANFLANPATRQEIALGLQYPPTLTFRGQIYRLVPEAIGDTGLFRTNGERAAIALCTSRCRPTNGPTKFCQGKLPPPTSIACTC
ncbi:MAG: hypothetical protein HC918_07065 [Oscillatoriales cyanobacterium SM2_1_8]|nr:hypothetical protein [Oscillatoriales cyanobacterium SM2_1_8]